MVKCRLEATPCFTDARLPAGAVLSRTPRLRCHPLRRLLGCHDGMNVEIHEVLPVAHPFIEERTIRRFHDLIARRQFIVHPTRNVIETLGRHASTLPKPPINRGCVAVSEVLDNHVQAHAGSPMTIRSTAVLSDAGREQNPKTAVISTRLP